MLDDTNDENDVFVHEITTGATTRISVNSDGSEDNGYSGTPSISSDGTRVAFTSSASNLVANDTNDTIDIFVHDLTTQTTSRVSVAGDGAEANNYSTSPSISADGTRIAYSSSALNLVPGDLNGFDDDVFVFDRTTSTTRRVSVASDGTQAIDRSAYSVLSLDGTRVADRSYATNLVPDDTGDFPHIYVTDLVNGTTYFASARAR